MTLVEFLRARLEEDVEHASAVRAADWEDRSAWEDLAPGVIYHARWHDPARVLAEVEAKRETVRLYEEAVGFVEMAKSHGHEATHYEVAAESYLNVIRCDAAVYADHADYREEWRP